MLFPIAKAILRRLVIVVIAVNLAVPVFLFIMSERVGLFTFPSEPFASDSVSIAAAASYAAARSPLIDRLLPAGAGGRHVVPYLGGHAGEARLQQAAIAMTSDVAVGRSFGGGTAAGEEVEVHELGHLLDDALPRLTSKLLAVVGPPDPESYAAEGPREHFAETMAEAWRLIRIQDIGGICPDYAGAVAHAERTVPGTAGMLMWFVPTWEAARDTTADSIMVAVAEELSAPYHDQWRAIADAVERRRDAEGNLTAWPVPGVAHHLRSAQFSLVTEPSWWRRAVGWALWPSAAVARYAEIM